MEIFFFLESFSLFINSNECNESVNSRYHVKDIYSTEKKKKNYLILRATWGNGLIDKASRKFSNFEFVNFISQTLSESFCSPRKNTLDQVAARWSNPWIKGSLWVYTGCSPPRPYPPRSLLFFIRYSASFNKNIPVRFSNSRGLRPGSKVCSEHMNDWQYLSLGDLKQN